MHELLLTYDLTPWQWVLALSCGILIGMAKTGLGGVSMPVTPIMAALFGGRPSAGLVLPMLCAADLFAVWYYNRHADWRFVLRPLPWAVAGIAVALVVGGAMSDSTFKRTVAVVVLTSLLLMVWREWRDETVAAPSHWLFSATAGLAGGFATMMGNAAGPIMTLYLLSMRLPKNAFIGTAAWFFLIVNYLKVPLHVAFWHTITPRSLAFGALLLPAIAAGAAVGVRAVRHIPEKGYRVFVIAATALASLKLLF